MAAARPTRTQKDALALLAAGGAYRSTRAFADSSVIATGGRITGATAAVLVRNGWAVWGTEASLKKPLLLTDAGRAHLPATAGEDTDHGARCGSTRAATDRIAEE
ncbi:hypothetical protein [Streptomyces sp. MMBL 11-3]|uniref:hypothetical protein n=1 Tax=Streptomyces sp. MMBL 11-3 TaxID=3382639 RepID=UPI0039B68F65